MVAIKLRNLFSTPDVRYQLMELLRKLEIVSIDVHIHMVNMNPQERIDIPDMIPMIDGIYSPRR